MAARSGAGTGVVVGLVVFVMTTVILLTMTIVFYTQSTQARDLQAEAERNLDKYARSVQRATDRFKALESEADRHGQSVTGLLLDQREQVMSKVLGRPGDSVEELNSRLERYSQSAPNATYAEVLAHFEGELRAARNESEGRRQQIEEMRRVLTERDEMLQQYERSKDEEVQAVRDLIATFADDVQRYGTDVRETRAQMVRSLQELERTFGRQVGELQRTIDNLRTDLALRETQLHQVQDIVNQMRLKGQDPSMLVDARVLENANIEGQVFIDRGRVDRISQGLTFEVYDSPAQLQLTAEGNLPRGKASVQVIKVGETTSTARITRSTPGRPVVRGDVLANAVYDPDKTFLFLVHGKFDLDGDGRPSEHETERVRALISEWGGQVVEGNQVRGDLDFVVLGVQPTRPMDLPSNPTEIQVARWVEQNQAYQVYNEILRDAMRAHIPVLNHNRFLILIGHTNN